MIVYSKEMRERSSERRMGLRPTISQNERLWVPSPTLGDCFASFPFSLRVTGMTKGGRRGAQGRIVPPSGYCLRRLQ